MIQLTSVNDHQRVLANGCLAIVLIGLSALIMFALIAWLSWKVIG